MKPWLLASAVTLPLLAMAAPALADDPPPPTMLDPNLAVRKVVKDLTGPTSMAFLPNANFDLDLLVLERRSGKVRRFQRESPAGAAQELNPLNPPLDLKVNSAGTRGLLGIALHPDFANPDPKKMKPWVYLFWTDTTATIDSRGQALVSDLSNHVDRYLWTGSTLTPNGNLINLRALQEPPPSENRAPASHNGGVLRFGPDKKLLSLLVT
jgi:aldose sugar dehydrogenase